MSSRPLPSPGEPPAGHRYVPVPAPRWRAREGMSCRYLIHEPVVWTREGERIQRRYACGAPSVAALNRYRTERGRRNDSWWGYCAEHTAAYHRWVVGDRVLEWQLQEIEGEETA